MRRRRFLKMLSLSALAVATGVGLPEAKAAENERFSFVGAVDLPQGEVFPDGGVLVFLYDKNADPGGNGIAAETYKGLALSRDAKKAILFDQNPADGTFLERSPSFRDFARLHGCSADGQVLRAGMSLNGIKPGTHVNGKATKVLSNPLPPAYRSAIDAFISKGTLPRSAPKPSVTVSPTI